MIEWIQAMQKEFHLFPESAGELRLSSEPSDITCGSLVPSGVDTSSTGNDADIQTLRSAISLEATHSSF